MLATSMPIKSVFGLLAVLASVTTQGVPLHLPADGFDLYHSGKGDAELTRWHDATGTVLRLVIAHPAKPFYTMALNQALFDAVPEGTRLVFRFRARSSTGNPLRAVVELKGEPWTSLAETSPRLTPEWRDYRAVGTARQAYPTNALAVRFQLGHRTGDIELAAIAIDNEGPDPGWAAARAALEPDAMRDRIDRVRKGALAITVTGPDGRPLPGSTVHIAQTRHAFLFGANIFELRPDNDERWQRAYQERFTNLFNYATLPFYWGAFEHKRGEPDYRKLDAMAGWCASHGLAMKGHPLVWHEVWPDWAPATADDAIPLLHARVTNIVTRYRDTIHYWDVLNEANNASAYADHAGEAGWIVRDGPAEVVATALGWAREAARGGAATNTLLYNDFNTAEPNLALLEALQKRGALPDAIGIQSHMHAGTWPLEEVWAVAERFSRFNRPIHFTEVTVLSGHSETNATARGTAWPSTPDEEVRQADYVASFYTLLFSHPAVRAITWWDFSDRGAWKEAPAGFLRANMTPKPVYDRLMGLIHGAWWTDLTGRTGDDGRFETRVFGGEHDVIVTDACGRSVTRHISVPPAGGQRLTIIMPE